MRFCLKGFPTTILFNALLTKCEVKMAVYFPSPHFPLPEFSVEMS